MRTRTLAVLGIAAYAVFLVATIPASLVAARIGDASQGAVQLEDPHGTLWNGYARATVTAPGARVTLDRIEWSFVAWRLAAGQLAYHVVAAARGLDARLTVGRGLSRWALDSVDARMDAALAATWVPLLGASHPEGVVAITSPSFKWSDDGRADGKLNVAWSDAALSFSEVKPLGKYSLDATAENGPANFTVATASGPLRIAGHGTFSPPSRVTFSGEARGEGTEARTLEPLLDLMGPRRGDGARALELRISP